MKYLLVGLGNIGAEYADNRHNIGFMVLDELAKQQNTRFSLLKLAYYTELNFKGRSIHLIKPTTYMNLSGKAVNYYTQQLNIETENILVIVDDLAIPFGSLRIKPKGSAAGHNGLKSIEGVLGSNEYARLKFGISDNFAKGQQVDYVLSAFNKEEQTQLPLLINTSIEMVKSFTTSGISLTMTNFNK
ncbi:MAG: aminoacyl-tRNA hydrolase [Sphingobacteriales bacterium]|nr:MAG: aminoacyl-tRNA hydrolase [Sphingobacteriales bacterium]TAF79917.1 MAG: aminoacyl-tRNA hydrolase [Sphingobacteriales bacterium]